MNSEWKQVPLGNITKWSSGGTPSKNNSDYWNGTIPWITAKNMPECWLYDAEPKITELGLKAGSRLAPKNSVLMLVRGSGLYNHRYICIVKNPVAFNQDIKCIEATDKIQPEFLYYLLKGNDAKLLSLLESTGIGAGKFDVKRLQQMLVNIPPLSEQEKIVDILSAIDSKIQLNNKINENLEQQAQAIYKSWFVDFEPFNYAQPDDWLIGTINDLAAEIVCGKTPSTKKKEYYGNDVPFITIPDMHRAVYVLNTSRSLSVRGAESQAKKTLPMNSVMVSCIGTPGLVALVSVPSQTNQQINSIIPKEGISSFYIYLLMQTMSETINKLGQGGSTIVNLNKTQFGKINVLIPSVLVMKDFDSIVSPLFAMILSNQKENKRLAELRDTLLPRLISGEIDVKDVQI